MARKTDGARLASAFAQTLSETLNHHDEAHAEDISRRKRDHVTSVLEMWESELKEVLGPLLARIVPDSSGDDVADHVLGLLKDPSHQVELIALVFAIQPIVTQFIEAILGPIVQNVANTAWAGDPSLGLSAQEAAMAVIRGWIDINHGANIARSKGVGPDAFATMVNANRLPPGVQTVIAGWNRGLVGQDDVVEAVRRSDIDIAWANMLANMRYAPLSPSIAVEAAVQSHLSLADAQAAYAMAGADPHQFEVAYETAGEPPGPQEMIVLLHKGLMTEAQVRQGLAESRVKNKYIDALIAGQYKTVPLRSVTSFVTKGILSDAEALQELQWDGYTPELAHKIVAAAHVTKVSATHELTKAELLSLYKAGEIDRTKVTSTLVALGHNASDIALLLGLADHQAQQAAAKQQVGVIRAAYMNGGATRNSTSGELDRAGLAATARDLLLATWDAELAERIRPLSEAQIVGAGKKGIIAPDEVLGRLQYMGYSTRDALILMSAGTIDITGLGTI